MICRLVDVAPAHRIDAFVEPPDRRPERDAVRADLPLAFERLEQVPERIVFDLSHSSVVHLIDVDVIGAQAAKRRLERTAHEVRRKIVRQLGLSASPRLVAGEVVTELSRINDALASICERRGELFFTATVAVSVGCIEERDAQIGGRAQHRNRVVVGLFAPPTGRGSPETEADLAYAYVAVRVRPVLHGRGLLRLRR